MTRPKHLNGLPGAHGDALMLGMFLASEGFRTKYGVGAFAGRTREQAGRYLAASADAAGQAARTEVLAEWCHRFGCEGQSLRELVDHLVGLAVRTEANRQCEADYLKTRMALSQGDFATARRLMPQSVPRKRETDREADRAINQSKGEK